MNPRRSPRRAALDRITFKPATVRHVTRHAAGLSDDVVTAAVRARVRSEFLEMPGLSLTTAQACRLFDVPEALCQRVLTDLVHAGVLSVRGDGRYVRHTDASV